MCRADRLEPDIVITTASGLQSGEPVLPSDVSRLAPRATILVLCDHGERRVGADGVVQLPRSTSLAQLRNEVIATATTAAARAAVIPLLNRPSKRA
jgi:hypothetical protein